MVVGREVQSSKSKKEKSEGWRRRKKTCRARLAVREGVLEGGVGDLEVVLELPGLVLGDLVGGLEGVELVVPRLRGERRDDEKEDEGKMRTNGME